MSDSTPLPPTPFFHALTQQGPALEGYVARRLPAALRGQVDPADVVHDVYLEAVRRDPWYDPAADPSGGRRLLFTIARRRIGRLLERHRASRQVAAGNVAATGNGMPDLLEALTVDDRTPDVPLVERERAAAVRAALGQLSADHARVLVLRYVDRLPAAVVAERTGRTPAAVDKLLQRAVAALRARLTGPSCPA